MRSPLDSLLRWLAAICASAALLTGALGFLAPEAAQAYDACKSASSGTLSSSTGSGGSTVDFTGTFKDCNGNTVAGATVTFSQTSGPGNCKVTFSSTTGTTNAQGQVTVTVTLPANCPGQYVLAATAPGAQVQAALVETGGFPNTTAPAQPSGPSNTWLLLVGIGALIALASAAGFLGSFGRQG